MFSTVAPVSLLVRLWVEMVIDLFHKKTSLSQPPREAVSWNMEKVREHSQDIVSLLVRLWVEMWLLKENGQERKSASSWGCELKYHLFQFEPRPCSQPPREAVSWNTIDLYRICKTTCQPPREAVSWNRHGCDYIAVVCCQPPREAVSWNICRLDSKKEVDVSLLVRLWVEITNNRHTAWPVRGSASSWGCELKWLLKETLSMDWNVSLLVRLWVEIRETRKQKLRRCVSLLVRLWVEITLTEEIAAKSSVSLLVRLWVEIVFF